MGNTLDQSYDQGGAGAGRIITADAGAVKIAGAGGLEVDGTIQSGSSIVIDGVTNHKISTTGSNELTLEAQQRRCCVAAYQWQRRHRYYNPKRTA